MNMPITFLVMFLSIITLSKVDSGYSKNIQNECGIGCGFGCMYQKYYDGCHGCVCGMLGEIKSCPKFVSCGQGCSEDVYPDGCRLCICRSYK